MSTSHQDSSSPARRTRFFACARPSTAYGRRPELRMPSQTPPSIKWGSSRVPTRLQSPPSTLPLPKNTPPSLYTINSGCGALWRSAPIQFQALQASLSFLAQVSYRVVVQQWSRARVELLSESRRVFQVWYSSFVILFILAFTLFSIYLRLYSSIIALLYFKYLVTSVHHQ